MSDAVRDAFEARFKSLDLSIEQDSWGVPQYKHSHVDALWAGWQAAQSQPAPPVPADVQEIMRLMMPYVAACVEFNKSIRGGLAMAEVAAVKVNAAYKPLEAALTALVEKNHELQFSLDGVNAMRPMPNMDAMQIIYSKGWDRAAIWANRSDLHSDVGSPAYLKDMANDLTEFADAALGGVNAMRGSNWVNIDAEPPPKRVEILVWNGKKRRIGIIAAENGRMMDAKTNQVLYPAPTHWMPMPAPPTHGIEPEQGEAK